MKRKRKPTTPGEILDEEFLAPLGISQSGLARHIGCDVKVINRIVNEKSRVTPEMALKFAECFETTPDFWLNAQMAVDLWKAPLSKRIPSLLKKRKRKMFS
ncbi:HigA family addiction module antitoxin [Simkania sp.]|uniref:HigA family addiction module antitoxin n=1 Tax=Simkania sp. TaxID=34094 RepID=UPI003B51A4E9